MKNKQPSVSIVLLNYNGYNDTIECIKSLKNITYNNYKIVIVDNNSTDNSEIEIKKFIKNDDNIQFIQSYKNLGFSGGNNIGIRYALENNADYICLLNNDTIVETNFLSELVNSMEKDNKIGVAAGKIMYFEDKDIIWSAGGFISEIKSLGEHYGIDIKDSKQFDDTIEVSFLTGCLQLIRKEVFEEIGMYDDIYFLYMEDLDFCKRVTRKGYKLMYIPQSKIYHKVSASIGGFESPLQLYYVTRNRILFNKKNQNNFIKSILFYAFMIIKMLIEPFRKKENYKYMLEGIKDGIKNKYGFKDITTI